MPSTKDKETSAPEETEPTKEDEKTPAPETSKKEEAPKEIVVPMHIRDWAERNFNVHGSSKIAAFFDSMAKRNILFAPPDRWDKTFKDWLDKN